MEALSAEEQDKLQVELRAIIYRLEAAEELSQLIGRMKDKAQRKANEL